MKLSLIVATDRNGVIGNQGSIPWRLPRDLRNFRRVTWGKPVIMGRETWSSLNAPLAGRTNIVLSKKCTTTAFLHQAASWFAPNIDEAIRVAELNGAAEAMVIGGGQIYKTFLPLCQTIHFTLIDADFSGDTFFPVPPHDLLCSMDWTAWYQEYWESDPDNPYDATYFVLRSNKNQ